MTFFKKNTLGILLCIIIASISTCLSAVQIGAVSLEVVGAPVFAILIGMLLTLFFPTLATRENTKPGISFTSKKILQAAVVILGFSLNIGIIVQVGAVSLPVIVSTILTSLIVALLLMKLLRTDRNVACLIGVGSSICGGSAIAATAPIIGASDEDVAQSISVIFLFNVLAALIFPTLGYHLGLGTEGFAIFAGTAVNDTSSVTAAAATAESIYGTHGILSAAVTVKLTRTLAIIPITLILASIRIRKENLGDETGTKVSMRKIFPTFILFFLAASVITTIVGLLPASGFNAFYNNTFVTTAKWLAKFFIAMAMCAIGLNTNIVNLIRKGGTPIILGFSCWVSIIVVSLLVQHLTGIFYSNL